MWVQSDTAGLHVTLFDACEFRYSRCRDRRTLFTAVNEILPVFAIVFVQVGRYSVKEVSTRVQ
jgi:hypothetical protein